MTIEDRRITGQQIAYVLDVSTYTVYSTIHDQLHMTEVFSRWVSHLLIPGQRHERAQSCQELLAHYSAEDLFFFEL